MNIEEVKRISAVSKIEKWPYPKTFQKLLDAGVISYRTSIVDNRTIYFGANNQFEETHDKETHDKETHETTASILKVATDFQAHAVKSGLEHHQKHQTPYAEFIKDMAGAGVKYYEVDMLSRTINYTSGKTDESYLEAIPVFE